VEERDLNAVEGSVNGLPQILGWVDAGERGRVD
jgi:hypothetical protein